MKELYQPRDPSCGPIAIDHDTLDPFIKHLAEYGIRHMTTSDLLSEVEYVRYEFADIKQQGDIYPNKRQGAHEYTAYIIHRLKTLKAELDRRALLLRQGDFPQTPIDFIRRVRDHIDITDIFTRYLNIQIFPNNANRWKYVCPAHSDKHPSGVLYLNQPQHYHCFQCQANGDCFDALMAFKGMTFMQSVDTCAAYLGWSMPEKKRVAPSKAPKSPKASSEPKGFFL